MGVLIDVNTIPSVFCRRTCDHSDYEPVLKWIIKDKGKMIVGGTKYKKELENMSSYLKFFLELSKLRKIFHVVDDDVDQIEIKLKKIESDSDFDDAHLVAIIICSECRIFCSKDSRAFKFIKDHRFYPNSQKRPSIYTNHERPPQRHILREKNLSPKCRPHNVLPSDVADRLFEMLT